MIEMEVAAGESERRVRSYVARHWRGELPLATSYWVNGILVGVGIGVLAVCVFSLVPAGDSFVPWIALTALVGFWLLTIAVTAWQSVGVWRSAGHHASRGGKPIWAGLAKLAVVLGLLCFAFDVAGQAAPAIFEYAKIVAGDPDLPPNRLRVLRHGTEAEFAGGIRFGATEELRHLLDANPAVRVLHLNSIGGRILEARKMSRLIHDRGLTTVTSTGCASACVLAFLGGRARYLGPDGRLGFHEESFPGLYGVALFEEVDRQSMLSLGIPAAFVDKAFSTPPAAVWYPTAEELQAAHVITGVSWQFAITGFDEKNLAGVVDRMLAQSVYAAIREADPAAYRSLRSAVMQAVRSGASTAEIAALITRQIAPVVFRYASHASDAAVIAMANAGLSDLTELGRRDVEACYAYLFPGKASNEPDLGKILGSDRLKRDLDVEALLVRDGRTSNLPVPTADEIRVARAGLVWALAGRGDDAASLAQFGSPGMDHRSACKIATDIYRTSLELPKEQQGPMLRYLFSFAGR